MHTATEDVRRGHQTLIVAWTLGCLLCGVTASSAETVRLWPRGLPPGAEQIDAERAEKLNAATTSERIAYVDDPTLDVRLCSPDNANGCGVIICPGGGYHILAWEKEGIELADWFNSFGVSAFVLKYRVPRRNDNQFHREPLQDVQRAIRLVRHRAAEYRVDPDRIGVLGFSAGGHLTLMAGTAWARSSYQPMDTIDQADTRPNFICPIYAAYMGDDYQDDVAELGSLIKITKKTPPTFLAVTWDDSMRGAQAALLFVQLRKHQVPAELHVYSNGGHGYGIRPSDKPVSTWHHRLRDWMQFSGLLADQD